MKEYIATLQPTTEGSHVAATLLLDHFDQLDNDDVDKLIEIIVTAEDGPWRSRLLLNMMIDANALGRFTWPQLKRLTKAMGLATEANKPNWWKSLEAAFPPK